MHIKVYQVTSHYQFKERIAAYLIVIEWKGKIIQSDKVEVS